MLNQQETNSSTQVDKFTEALTKARRMQRDWLQYGLNFVHIYVDDVEGDWLENWGNDDEILCDPHLDAIKEFLVSNDHTAREIRDYLNQRNIEEDIQVTLFDLAVDLAECSRINPENAKLSAIISLLTSLSNHVNDAEVLNLADDIVRKLTLV
jgi:hypothetical protein